MSAADLANLEACLRIITNIRSGTAQVKNMEQCKIRKYRAFGCFQVCHSASSGLGCSHGDEHKEKRFLSELKALLDGVQSQIK